MTVLRNVQKVTVLPQRKSFVKISSANTLGATEGQPDDEHAQEA